jgi:hypothetical protein
MPIEASAVVSWIMVASGGIIDIAPYVRWIITAAIIVGIVIVDVTRTHRQLNPWAARTTFANKNISPGAFGLENGLPC